MSLRNDVISIVEEVTTINLHKDTISNGRCVDSDTVRKLL